jgi:hypothetical protein
VGHKGLDERRFADPHLPGNKPYLPLALLGNGVPMVQDV